MLFTADWMNDIRALLNYGNDFSVAAAAPRISALVRETLQSAQREFLLISLEGMTNPFVDTQYVFPKGVYLKARHAKVLLNSLLEQGTQIRILITIRNQRALLPSLFSQVYFQAFSMGLVEKSYDSFLDLLFVDDTTSFGAMLYYDQLAEHYGQLFGKKNVFLVAMEELFAGMISNQMEKLSAFLSIEPPECISLIGKSRLNARNPGSEAAGKRRMMAHSPASDVLSRRYGTSLTRAAFGWKSLIRMRFGRPVYWTLPDRSERIASFYRKSNERLFELYDIRY